MITLNINDTTKWHRLAPIGYARAASSDPKHSPPSTDLARNNILVGDTLTRLRQLPTASIDCCITSPPYFALRNYGVDGQMGLEADVDAWTTNLRSVMGEVARVLKPTGSLWLNLGDSFSRGLRYGAPAKSLLCGPERLLLKLAQDGWIVRGKVIWSKPNGLPSPVTDRPNLNYEYIYFLVRSPRYFFDLDAIREPHRSKGAHRRQPPIGKAPEWAGPLAGSQDGLRRARPAGMPGHPLGKNPGSVWQIPTHGFRGAHFATFPEALIRRPLLATCPPGGIVLDPFIGSGTTAVVAEELGRDWIGVELNADYAELAMNRIEEARSKREGVMTRTTNEERGGSREQPRTATTETRTRTS